MLRRRFCFLFLPECQRIAASNFTASSAECRRRRWAKWIRGARASDDKRKVSIYLNLFRIMNQKSVLSLVVSCRLVVVPSGLLFMETEGEQAPSRDHEYSKWKSAVLYSSEKIQKFVANNWFRVVCDNARDKTADNYRTLHNNRNRARRAHRFVAFQEKKWKHRHWQSFKCGSIHSASGSKLMQSTSSSILSLNETTSLWRASRTRVGWRRKLPVTQEFCLSRRVPIQWFLLDALAFFLSLLLQANTCYHEFITHL